MDNENKKHLENLNEIRSIMERSSSFLSLSGLSGIFAGIFALIGAGFAYWYIYIFYAFKRSSVIINPMNFDIEIIAVLFIDAAIVLFLAIASGYWFTYINSKKKGLKMWNPTSKKLIIALLIPLATGGLFSLILIWHGATYIISSTTLKYFPATFTKLVFPDPRSPDNVTIIALFFFSNLSNMEITIFSNSFIFLLIFFIYKV